MRLAEIDDSLDDFLGAYEHMFESEGDWTAPFPRTWDLLDELVQLLDQFKVFEYWGPT